MCYANHGVCKMKIAKYSIADIKAIHMYNLLCEKRGTADMKGTMQ